MRPSRLVVDPIACDGRGLCAELFPEGVRLDDWGFPMVAATPIPDGAGRHAQRAVTACPRLALKLVDLPPAEAPGREEGGGP